MTPEDVRVATERARKLSTLKFSERAHRYHLDGKPIPGVTTLLGKGLPKPALMYWSARTVAEYVADKPDAVEQLRTMGRGPMIAALKGVPWESRDQAAVRGTDVHALAEQVVHGTEVAVPEHLVPYVEGYVKLLDELELHPILTERRIANRRWWFAGTFDLLAMVGGRTLLLDLKTSKAIYGSVALQVAAYANAEFYVADDGTEAPLPHVDGIGAIHVTDAGATLHEFPDPADAWKCFQHVAWVAKRIPTIEGWGPGDH